MTVAEYTDKEFLDRYLEKTKEHWQTLYSPILGILGNPQGKIILDIGCGPGELTNRLAELGARAIGIDTSEEWIDYCKKNYSNNKNAEFLTGNTNNLHMINSESIDTVIASMVFINIDRLDDVKKAFEEARRVLKRGGSFIFSDLDVKGIMDTTMPTREIIFPKYFKYDEGDSFNAKITLESGKVMTFQDRYWPNETYKRFLHENNFRLIETIGTGYKDREYKIFNCRKD